MRILRKIPIHIILIIGAITMVVPFLWMVSTSLKTPQATFITPNFFQIRPTWIPDNVVLNNYV